MHTIIDLADVSTECEADHHRDCDGCQCGCHDQPELDRFDREPWELGE